MTKLDQDALDAAADAMSEASYEANSGRDAAQRVVEAYLAALPASDFRVRAAVERAIAAAKPRTASVTKLSDTAIAAYVGATAALLEKPELDPAELDFWRQVIRGEAGYNGQPQALLGLLHMSDMQHLNRLRAAYPEAVAAVLESRS